MTGSHHLSVKHADGLNCKHRMGELDEGVAAVLPLLQAKLSSIRCSFIFSGQWMFASQPCFCFFVSKGCEWQTNLKFQCSASWVLASLLGWQEKLLDAWKYKSGPIIKVNNWPPPNPTSNLSNLNSWYEGCGGGVVVSILAFNAGDLSSNPAVYNLSVLYFKKEDDPFYWNSLSPKIVLMNAHWMPVHIPWNWQPKFLVLGNEPNSKYVRHVLMSRY